MCCFSGPVQKVESTKIFARMSAPARQVLIYEMRLVADAEVAMILPIPTPPRSAEHAVRFVSLERYPELFTDLQRAFPAPAAAGPPRAFGGAPPQPLAVHSVGAFVASFVPHLSDFGRLDARFRIPAGTIDAVPEYRDWGFAVFQLKGSGALTRVHPMAFEMPTRRPDALFFPTVHVHDGALHPEADFAHVLYGQFPALPPAPDAFGTMQPRFRTPADWWAAGIPLGKTVDGSRSEGLVDLESSVATKALHGKHPNRDVWASLA